MVYGVESAVTCCLSCFPVKVSLFFDIFMCLTKEMTAHEYEKSHYYSSTSTWPSSSQDQALLCKLKATIWKQLVEVHKVAMKAGQQLLQPISSLTFICCIQIEKGFH